MSQRTVTEKMVEANRQNAQKSTGPKTEEGKARSSQNSVRHGILAQHMYLTDTPAESPENFEIIMSGLYDAYNPQDGHETILIQRIAVSYWRLARAYRYESHCLQTNRAQNPDADPNEFLLPNPQQMERIVRYEGMIGRDLNRNINQLLAHQAYRRARAQERAAAQKAEEDNAFMRLLPDPQTFLAKVGLLTEEQIQQAARECEEEQNQKKSPRNSAKPTSPEKPPDPSN